MCSHERQTLFLSLAHDSTFDSFALGKPWKASIPCPHAWARLWMKFPLATFGSFHNAPTTSPWISCWFRSANAIRVSFDHFRYHCSRHPVSHWSMETWALVVVVFLYRVRKFHLPSLLIVVFDLLGFPKNSSTPPVWAVMRILLVPENISICFLRMWRNQFGKWMIFIVED